MPLAIQPDPGARAAGFIGAAAIAVFAAWACACLWYPLTDTDIWWHLAAAKLMWSRQAFLRADPFCLSSLGTPWIDLHWGFQILAYAAWKAGGAAALIAGKCAAVTGALLSVIRPHFDRRTWPWILPCAALGAYQVRFLLDVRPLALTMLGLGIIYAVVISHLRGGLRNPWWILIPIQVILANLQGLYPLGALLATCLTAGTWVERRFPACNAVPGSPSLRGLGFACLAMWAAGLATPYGWKGFLLPFALLGRITPQAGNVFSREIAENLPFADLARRDFRAALPFLILAGFTLWSFWRARGRFSPGHALIFVAFGALGWMAQRNLPLFLMGALIAAGRNLQVFLESRRSPGMSAWTGLAALAAICAVHTPTLRAAWAYELPGSLVTPFRVPSGAVDWLETHPIAGNIFNELRFGGYLSWRLHPKPAFVDGRMILRSGEFYAGFLEVVDHPETFEPYRLRHGITHALLPIAEDRRFQPLAAYLLRSGWALAYCDGGAALLAASETSLPGMPIDKIAFGHPLLAALSDRYGANPRLRAIAIGNAADFLAAAGKERAAADLLPFR